jgi:hypothetical protein
MESSVELFRPNVVAPHREVVGQLALFLGRGGIDTNDWYKKGRFELPRLLGEVVAGEAELALDSAGVYRRLSIAAIDVYHLTSNGPIFYLQETKQVTRYVGTNRHRRQETSLGEKLVAGEHPDAGARRALAEELSIEEPEGLYYNGSQRFTRPTGKFPGVITDMKVFNYVATIAAQDFRPKGYVEVQQDKKNFFNWQQLAA